MKIPFLDRFKKDAEPAPAAATPAKADSGRLSKTIMPSAPRKAATEEFATPPPAMPSIAPPLPADFAPPPLAPEAVVNEPAPAPAPAAPRTISFSPKRASTNKADLPPAVALALEPKVERAVPFGLREFAEAMPAGLTKPVASIDKDRRILLKAADLEKGMAARKPTVSVATLYSLVPDIFLQPMKPGDESEIELPFDLVLHAFSQMQIRRDQKSEQAVPQVSTPFLQATLEDNEKFGVTMEAPEMIEEAPLPNERLQLATAEALAAAEPDLPIGSPTAVMPDSKSDIPAPIALNESALTDTEAAPAKSTPERMPFSLPPKETGAPASERVPASCGPPVSFPLPPPPEPFRIPFQDETPAQTAEATALTDAADDRKISLSLKPILQSLPVFQLTGDPKEVSDDARIELPLSLVQSQLATGRVSVAPELFERSLPAEGRRFFSADNIEVPVILPLQEVLRNLPAASMRMRDDQEEDAAGDRFDTPFSTPAKEDAERLKVSPEPIALSLPLEEEEEPVAVAEQAAPIDAKTLITEVNQLDGVRACALTFTDGLSLAGVLPMETGTEGLCALAPSFSQKIEAQVAETKLGALRWLTIHCEKSNISFFLQNNICLSVLHGQEELTRETCGRIAAKLVELVNQYAQPEASHVHH